MSSQNLATSRPDADRPGDGQMRNRDRQLQKQENSRLLREDIAEKRLVFKSLPEIINLNQTSVCNLRCIMCFQAYTPGTETLPMSRVHAILDDVLPTAHKLKLTTAGEPLIGEFEEILDIADQYECKLDIITNATRLTAARLERMEGMLDHLAISIDSHVEEVLDHIRGEGVHRAIMKNFRELGEFLGDRPRSYLTSFNMVLMTSNVPHLSGFVRFAREAGVDHVRVIRMSYMTQELKEKEDPFHCFAKEELDRHIEDARQEAKRLGLNLILHEVGYKNVISRTERMVSPEPIQSRYCSQMLQEVYIQPNEAIYPCCIPGDLFMGSLKRNRFEEIWNGRAYQRLRKQMFSQELVGPCAKCKLYRAYRDDDAYDYIPGSRTLRGFSRIPDPLKKLADRAREAFFGEKKKKKGKKRKRS